MSGKIGPLSITADARTALRIKNAVLDGDYGPPGSKTRESAIFMGISLLQKSHKRRLAAVRVPKTESNFERFVSVKKSVPWLPIDYEILQLFFPFRPPEVQAGKSQSVDVSDPDVEFWATT